MKNFSLTLFTFLTVVMLGACGGGKNAGFGGGTSEVTLAPTTMTFTAETVGLISDAQTLTLTNSGAVTLHITNIASANNDFSSDSTACGATLAPSANCVISVTFTPTQAGALTGTITVTDDAPNSPQTVALTGTGTD